jgi:hypothetical protein
MKLLQSGLFVFTLLAGGPAFAVSDISPGSVNVPQGTGTVQTNPPDRKIEATRLPRRDTKSPLVCSAADGAPQLADRVSEGSCRSHTKEHQAEAQKSQVPVLPPVDVHAITGR